MYKLNHKLKTIRIRLEHTPNINIKYKLIYWVRSHFGWLNSSNLTFALVKLEEHLSIEWSRSDGWRRMKLQKYGFSCAVTISFKAFQPADQFEWNIGDRSNFWLKPSKTHVASGISSYMPQCEINTTEKNSKFESKLVDCFFKFDHVKGLFKVLTTCGGPLHSVYGTSKCSSTGCTIEIKHQVHTRMTWTLVIGNQSNSIKSLPMIKL